jgi:hypothetical protein
MNVQSLLTTLLLIVFSLGLSGQAGQTYITFEGTMGVGRGQHIVLVSGDEEYRSEEALPQLARILAYRHGFKTTVLFAQNPQYPGVVDPNFRDHIEGTELLATADLMVIFTRFRSLPASEMKNFEEFLKSGKPVVAIRTATHAFEFGKKESSYAHWSNFHDQEGDFWDGGFGRAILGERWYTHHGHHKHQSTRGLIDPFSRNHPILRGIEDGQIWGATDVYGVRLPLPGDALPLILGQTIDRSGAYDEDDLFYGLSPNDHAVASKNPGSGKDYNPNDPLMPIAWTKSYQLPDGKKGMAFTSTIGSSVDLLNEGVRRLIINAVIHLSGLEVPQKTVVDIVGDYQPTQFNFHTDEYWQEKKLLISDIQNKE